MAILPFFASKKRQIGWELLKVYFIVGGLPEAVLTYMEYKDKTSQVYSEVRNIQERLITMYKADIAKHSGKVNSMHIDRLWSNIPAQLSSEYDGSTNKYKFKDVIPGMNKYSRLVGAIDWLLATGLVRLFIFDVGILGALNNLEPKSILDYDYGTYKGYFAENFVAQEFIYRANSKSLSVFNEIYKPPYRVKISAKELSLDEENKVYNYPLYLASKFPL